MGFYFFFRKIINVRAMMNEFPEAFRLVFIDDGNTDSFWLFNLWPFLVILIVLFLFSWAFLLLFLWLIQKSWVVCVGRKVDVTVRTFVINLKAIVVINVVSFVFVGSVGSDLE
jgi:hypothetical protein